MIHPALSYQMCDQDWIQLLGREGRGSAASSGLDPGNSGTMDCLDPSGHIVETCLELPWCQKVGLPCAKLCMWLEKAHSVRTINRLYTQIKEKKKYYNLIFIY